MSTERMHFRDGMFPPGALVAFVALIALIAFIPLISLVAFVAFVAIDSRATYIQMLRVSALTHRQLYHLKLDGQNTYSPIYRSPTGAVNCVSGWTSEDKFVIFFKRDMMNN